MHLRHKKERTVSVLLPHKNILFDDVPGNIKETRLQLLMLKSIINQIVLNNCILLGSNFANLHCSVHISSTRVSENNQTTVF